MRISISLIIATAGCFLFTQDSRASDEHDYPTAIRADYVFACMAANGQTYEILQKCSCSIDYIAKRLAFSDYEQAETILRIQQDAGQRGVFYKEAQWAKDRLDKFNTLQAESTLACFK